jgi:dihydrofolate reductase
MSTSPSTLPLALIAALADNQVIGIDNRLPWHLPADLRHFKAMTLGKPVIMGRKTWDSLGRPLPGRLNLVVSRQAGLQLEGAEVFASLEAAIARADAWARERAVDELMLIGGAELYAQGLAQATRLYLTRVHLSPAGDAFFPAFAEGDWQRVASQMHEATAETPAHTYETWARCEPLRTQAG